MVSLSDAYRSWLRHLSANRNVKVISDEFAALRDNLTRVNYALNLIEDFPFELEYVECGKNNEESKRLRDAGNELFKLKKDQNAFECYTKSIGFSSDGSENLGLAYGNRSAVLFQCGLYEECLIVRFSKLVAF